MSKTIVINQPAGLGDIIWSQPVLKKFLGMGFNIIYPIADVYFKSVSTALKSNGITFVPYSSNFLMKEFFNIKKLVSQGDAVYVPLTFSHQILGGPIMMSKYALTKTPLYDYRNYVHVSRDFDREARLLDVLGVNSEPFSISAPFFGTPPNTTLNEFVPRLQDGSIMVLLDPADPSLQDYSLFDWIGVIELASEIHTVSSAFAFFADIFARESCSLYMYERSGGLNRTSFFNEQQFIFRNPRWEYVLNKSI
jgi:hypothetical protein